MGDTKKTLQPLTRNQFENGIRFKANAEYLDAMYFYHREDKRPELCLGHIHKFEYGQSDYHGRVLKITDKAVTIQYRIMGRQHKTIIPFSSLVAKPVEAAKP